MIVYEKVKMPEVHNNYLPVELNETTMQEHYQKVMAAMHRRGLDSLIVYADREHGANFAYLTGFEPRFEEAVLVLHKDGRACLLFGNENLKMGKYSFLKAEVIHVPYFSLPCQPMGNTKDLQQLFLSTGLTDKMKIGIAGWKFFTSEYEDNSHLFDTPHFIVDTVREINKNGETVSSGDIFLHPEDGVRIRMNANEIAHYEFGAGLASKAVFQALNSVAPGKTEMEIAGQLAAFGQPQTVTTICACGERFTNAVVFPRNKKISLGDKFSLTLGFRGGLTSRAAYVVHGSEELPAEVKDYLEAVVKPYYRAIASWYQWIGIDADAGEIYQNIESILPRETYHWTLNPGHYTSAEEWTSSSFYAGSDIRIKSGMLLQADIIPSVAGYGGTGAEDGLAVADQALQKELAEQYPQTYRRMIARQQYMRNELGIELKNEILPMSDIAGYLRPYILNHEYAMKIKKEI